MHLRKRVIKVIWFANGDRITFGFLSKSWDFHIITTSHEDQSMLIERFA